MDELNILLCCGAGMSSGLLAQKSRKAAKKRKLSVSVEARSESEASQYFSSIDILLLGPHYENYREELQKQADPYNVPVRVIPKEIYGMIDGDKLLDFAIQNINK